MPVMYFLVVFGLYIYLIFPRMRHKPDMSPFCQKPTAHRGVHDNVVVAENSMTAFRAAIDAGYGIELDVQLTGDGEVVVFHDDNLLRMCGENRTLLESTLEELKTFKLLGTEDSIPTLRETLSAIDGKVPVIIEMKNERAITDLPGKLYEIMKDYDGYYSVESFNPIYVGKYKKLDRSVARGILSCKFGKVKKYQLPLAKVLENLLMNFIARPDFVAYQFTDGKKLSVRLNRLFGAKTVAWTISTDEELQRAKKYFDAFICDMSDSIDFDPESIFPVRKA